MRRVMYVAHPVAPTDGEIAQARARAELVGNMPTDAMLVRSACHANVARAGRWLQWLRKSFPETTFIAPWMVSILTGDDDTDPAQREAGLVDCCATVERCDGIVLCGPRISSGMRREMLHGTHRLLTGSWFGLNAAPTMADVPEFWVYDLTPPAIGNLVNPTLSVLSGRSFLEWFGTLPTPQVTP